MKSAKASESHPPIRGNVFEEKMFKKYAKRRQTLFQPRKIIGPCDIIVNQSAGKIKIEQDFDVNFDESSHESGRQEISIGLGSNQNYSPGLIEERQDNSEWANEPVVIVVKEEVDLPIDDDHDKVPILESTTEIPKVYECSRCEEMEIKIQKLMEGVEELVSPEEILSTNLSMTEKTPQTFLRSSQIETESLHATSQSTTAKDSITYQSMRTSQSVGARSCAEKGNLATKILSESDQQENWADLQIEFNLPNARCLSLTSTPEIISFPFESVDSAITPTCAYRKSDDYSTGTSFIKALDKVRPNYCHICDKVFSSKLSLALHQRVHSKNKKQKPTNIFKCPHCLQCFTRKFNLERHIKIHSTDYSFACVFCDEAFCQQELFHSHIRSHIDELPFSCKQCGKSFKDEVSLYNHRHVHVNEDAYIVCAPCGKRFKTKKGFNHHNNVTHLNSINLLCVLCPKHKYFTTLCRLNDHVRKHCQEKPYQCNACEAEFSSSQQKTRHKLKCPGRKTLCV